MRKIYNWFKRPYFVDTNPITNFLISLGLGVFIFLFLYLFEPFGIRQSNNEMLFYTLGFGGVTFIVCYINCILFFIIFRKFATNDNWTVGKNIFFLFFTLLTIALCNHWYNLISFDTFGLTRHISFQRSVSNTFIVGVFPILIYMLYTEIFYRKKNEKIADEIMKNQKFISKKSSNLEEITIYGTNQKEVIIFNTDQLIYVSSTKNYSSFFLTQDTDLVEKILRIPLHKVLDQLSHYKWVVRCHKSYIVSTRCIQKITGNARGYQLHMKNLDFPVPVSRNFSKNVLALISS